MGKPMRAVKLLSLDDKSGAVNALFDTGAFFTLIREDCVPAGAAVILRARPKSFGSAARGAMVEVTGEIPLEVTIDDKTIAVTAQVSPNLAAEMIIGAGAMQEWSISVRNADGNTELVIGHHLGDPDVNTVM